MDDFYVILSILVLAIIIFIILFSPSPYSYAYGTDKNNKETRIDRIAHPPVTIDEKHKEAPKLVCYDPRMQSMNSRQIGPIGVKQDEETLASFYVPSNDNIPIDYPLKLVGECPYSKSLSSDLPVANVPLCLAEKDNFNMKLTI